MSTPSSDKPGCLGLLLQLFGVGPASATVESLPFRLRDDFLSPAEISFYHALLSAVGDEFTVCPKVNLNDIFFVSSPSQNQAARNQISRKHVDFLLCDRDSMTPRMGIELDDSSHAREDRQKRDALVEQVFAAAGLALVRFPVQHAYNISEIRSHLSSAFDEGAVPPPQSDSEDATATPLCSKCGIPLVIRSGSRGQFYGCSNYPKCRETVSMS